MEKISTRTALHSVTRALLESWKLGKLNRTQVIGAHCVYYVPDYTGMGVFYHIQVGICRLARANSHTRLLFTSLSMSTTLAVRDGMKGCALVNSFR